MRCIRQTVTLLALLSLGLSSANAIAKDNVEAWTGELPVRQPWLRDNLSDKALIYARIPNLYGLLATPKGNALSAALQSRVHVENITKIRKGLSDNVIPRIPLFADAPVRLLERHLRSPIEIAAFIAPAPSVMISLQLDINSNDALYALLDSIAAENPGFGLLEPLDDAGIGEIAGTGLPLFVRFSATDGRLLLNAGPGVNRESFSARLADTIVNNDHSMLAMERRIDEGGQGLFLWINSEQAMPPLQMFMPVNEFQKLTDLGLDKVRSAAFGWGVADRKGRLAVVVDVPAEGNRNLFPFVSNNVTAQSAGDPDGLFLLSIPSADEFSRIENLALESASDESREE